jgi:hypothetical protein
LTFAGIVRICAKSREIDAKSREIDVKSRVICVKSRVESRVNSKVRLKVVSKVESKASDTGFGSNSRTTLRLNGSSPTFRYPFLIFALEIPYSLAIL